MFNVKIAGTGSYVPKNCIGNAEIEQRLGLEPGWIERRTGILSRPVASKDLATSDLAVKAGAQALDSARIQPSDISLLLLATSTPDHLLPPSAPLVAHQLALTHAGAIDLAGACSGFLYAMALGGSYAHAMRKPVLVIAANILSRRVNQDDPATVALFGDGAGAIVLVPDNQGYIVGIYLGADGANYDSVRIPAGGTREPLTAEGLHEGRNFMRMAKGASLFKNASRAMAKAGREAMLRANLKSEDIDWWIPHQANLRLIREAGNLLGIPMERTITVIDLYANSSAATIPIALADAVGNRKIQHGDLLLLTAVGAGMLSAGLVVRWE